ncbi:hypothetical protein QDY71_05500 [Kingella negevensis]|uniref:Uncharacterized protein n=1 Tax=Kingella negevensis TaxID=1522312 RepID=A0A238HJG8_9NEIS|nr:hypothetical protein [Kingella negevensis]MDK4679373.1 hypothetical protein [Kingella negevensis]MDK4682907.1 hypothetical protein [Kingella negevensis]MDK4685488.1 hypothetical protein [Kingella negevensis]MDK4691106.1 hypothetical protein [Kingella negevensis]MDK4693747.1 hypothetical protein [Kingella negevensis]
MSENSKVAGASADATTVGGIGYAAAGMSAAQITGTLAAAALAYCAFELFDW